MDGPRACRPGGRRRPDDRGVRDRLADPAGADPAGRGRLHPAVGWCPVSVRAPLAAGTVLSLAVVSAWSYIASLAIGPAGPLHLGRNVLSDYSLKDTATTEN